MFAWCGVETTKGFTLQGNKRQRKGAWREGWALLPQGWVLRKPHMLVASPSKPHGPCTQEPGCGWRYRREVPRGMRSGTCQQCLNACCVRSPVLEALGTLKEPPEEFSKMGIGPSWRHVLSRVNSLEIRMCLPVPAGTLSCYQLFCFHGGRHSGP